MRLQVAVSGEVVLSIIPFAFRLLFLPQKSQQGPLAGSAKKS